MKLLFARSFIVKAINKIKRKSRGGKKYKSKKKEKRNIFTIIKTFVPKLPRILKIGILSIITFLFLGYNLAVYFSIITFPFDGKGFSESEFIDESSFHVAIYGFSEKDAYKYINYISLIIHGDRTKIIQVTPLFSSEKYQNTTLRTFLNTISGDEEVTQIQKLNDALSNILGVRIDKYITFEENNLINFFDNKFNIKNYLNKEIFNSEKIYEASFIKKQKEFTKNFFQNNFNIFNKILLFYSAPEFSSKIKTNMSRNQLLGFFNEFSSGKKLEIIDLGIEYGRIYESSDKNLSFKPNIFLIDEKLLSLLSSIDLIAEQAELEIYNASNIQGLASSISRELQNLGINVVKFGNYFEKENGSVLHLESESDFNKFRNTIISVKQSLRGNVRIAVGEFPYNRTGDLILVLGK